MKKARIFLMVGLMLLGFSGFAQSQNVVKGILLDDSTGEALGFATVSLTRDGQTKPAKYTLSDDKGTFSMSSIRNGSYAIVAELMGYEPFSKQIVIENNKSIDLGEIRMKIDREQLEAAEVSAIGNPVIVKKDTIEYNAGSFLTTENDNLIDLLKKMPGIEVADNGTISVNGQSVSKITVQGKTFFLDDPQVASQNIPAKLVKKLKVIRKKSEQAEFTGIDDGQEETVIDLGLTEGANLNGIVGRVTAGVGHDLPSEKNPLNDWRFSGNAFLGNFSGKTQISLILNANNANVQGSTNFSGNMMGNMMGGGGMGGGMGFGGAGGINTSYMAGLNAAADLFDDRMTISGNYNYNNNSSVSEQTSNTISYLSGMNQMVDSQSNNINNSNGHNFGLRLEHKFSENTSIIFEPRVRFGGGNYVQQSESSTFQDKALSGDYNKVNYAKTNNNGTNSNISTSGFLMFRQRLGLPGRTLTVNTNFNLSDNKMDALNWNKTDYYAADGQTVAYNNEVNQHAVQDQQSYSVSTRATYTEPLGNYFYLEANYSYNWSKSISEKNTYDLLNGGVLDPNYSNSIINLNRRHEFGGNVLYQDDRMHLQAGFTAIPQYTYNKTNAQAAYEDNRWNFSPTVMMMFDLSDNASLRFFYRGQSSQPSTSQLMPVPDNTNPLRVTFGNPTLTPYFTHNINGEYRYSNRQNFSSFNIRANGGFTQNQISNVVITGANGGQYTIPFNAPTTANAGVNFFNNIPLDKKGVFSLNNNTGLNWRQSFAYEGVDVDMSKYTQSDNGFYEWMNWFIDQFNDPAYYKAHIVENYTDNLSLNERLRITYRGIQFQASIGASTNMNQTWYTQKGDAAAKSTQAARNSQTWSNAATAELTWNWLLTGISVTANANYRWYNGYTTPVDPQLIINMTVAKSFGPVNLSVYVADLLGQSRALSVQDQASRHVESVSKTLGRYFIVSLAYNFGTVGGRRGGGMRGGMGGGRRGGMGGGMMGGGMPPMGGGMMGGGRPMM
ncbi:MAG: outer membrane beta-barrel protein [Bacteroidales bacterium]|nr:outer membrane beta-barrel protein [Bacteroidales bacterium]